MKLAKAIELNKESEKSLRAHKFIDHADAIKIGYEAIKYVQTYRLPNPPDPSQLLPGEDPEPPTRRSLHHIREVQESPLGKEPEG